MIQTADTYTLTAALPLEAGHLARGVAVSYERYGDRRGEGAAVLLHDFTHSHRALGPEESSLYRPSGWARELVGRRKVLDPEHGEIFSLGLLGSPFGPRLPELDGAPLGVEDLARGAAAALKGLGVERARVVLGVGLGGMVALRLAALFPELTRCVVAIGAAATLPEGLRDHLSSVPELLRAETSPEGAMRLVRRLRLELLRRCYSAEYLIGAFADLYTADKALEAEADAFSRSFPAPAFARLCRAVGSCDLGPSLQRVRAPVLLVAGANDTFCPPSRVRDTYHQLTAGGAPGTRLHELTRDGGHATLLEDGRHLRQICSEFFSAERERP